eukprot:2805653-Pleurochrysis_carterae.AAC.1
MVEDSNGMVTAGHHDAAMRCQHVAMFDKWGEGRIASGNPGQNVVNPGTYLWETPVRCTATAVALRACC